MKAEIDFHTVLYIAQMIGRCDFRTTISLYTTGNNSPWIITVGESSWKRHLVMVEAYGSGEKFDAKLAVLSTTESDKFGYDIRVNNVEKFVQFKELVSDSYIGVKKVLFPPTPAS